MTHIDLKLHFPAWLAAVVLLALPATGARAQDTVTVTIEQLQEALAKRDAVIVDLLNRVRAIEQGQSTSKPDIRPDAAAVEMPVSQAAVDQREAARGHGEFEIDELAAERALERALVQEGARLLRPGQFNVEPRFTFSRRNGMFPAELMTGQNNVVGEISQTYEVHERSLDLRVGLPWESQLEIGLPYLTVDRTIETGIDGSVQSVRKESGSGAGDATVSLSKVLATESGARPNLIGRLVWLTGSGEQRDGEFVLGSGYSGFAGRLSAYWRRDPVVLLVSGGYTRYDDDPGLTPGDSLDVSLGLGLALSPETALQFSLNQTLANEFERDGTELRGTDRLSSTLDLAISTTLGRRFFLRGYTSAGLTDEAPDYGFGVSLSSRFDMR
jgi:hypothetical protein